MMNDANPCSARFGWKTDTGSPVKGTATRVVLVACGLEDGHDGDHRGAWRHNYPGTAGTTNVTWQEVDRRTFRGDYIGCPDRGCVLPTGHPRGHAQ